MPVIGKLLGHKQARTTERLSIFAINTATAALRASTVRVASCWKHLFGRCNEIGYPVARGFDTNERIGAGG